MIKIKHFKKESKLFLIYFLNKSLNKIKQQSKFIFNNKKEKTKPEIYRI